jgi:adenylate kinase
MKLIISGPPGSGKGSRASRIAQALKIPHISTGDLFRKEISAGTELGRIAKDIIEQGKLVPDEITMGMLKNRLKEPDCQKGFILDGVPRTLKQAEMLKEITEIEHVLNLEVSGQVIIDRMTSRRTCKGCGAIFNVKTMAPKVEGKCDHCSSELIQREDEKLEVISKRLEVYESQTKPLIEFYKEMGLLRSISGEILVEKPEFWKVLGEVLSMQF